MDKSAEAVIAEAVGMLRQAGAVFAYLHGSRAAGRYRAGSDIDIAAYFSGRPPQSFDVLLPAGVDLLVLDDAPLELAGRVAVGGRLLFEDDQVERVRWEAMTRKIYFDQDRILRLLRSITDDVSVLKGESGADEGRRGDPMWLRGIKWGPEGFTTTTRAFEFRVGGEWDFVMHGPDGTDYTEWIS